MTQWSARLLQKSHSLNGSMTLWSERCCPQKSKNSEIYKAPLKKRHAPMEPWLGSLKDDAPEGSRLDCLQDFPKSYSPMEPWVDGLKDSNPKGPRLNSLHNFTKKKASRQWNHDSVACKSLPQRNHNTTGCGTFTLRDFGSMSKGSLL